MRTDKAALGRSAAEGGAAPASQATGKELRGLIRRRLKGEGCPPVEGWLPRYFEFPSRGYTGRPVSEAHAAYDRLARGWAEEPTGGEADAEPDAGAPGWVEDRADAALDAAA